MEKRKTIFITVGRAGIAKNLLLGDFLDKLSQKFKVIILSPLYNDEEFLKLTRNIKVVPLYNLNYSSTKKKIELFLTAIHKSLIYNPTVEVRSLYGLKRRGEVRFKKFKIFVQKYILGKIFSHRLVRNFFKYIDRLILPCNLYDEIIDRYKPNLVFVTNICGEEETAFIRNCKKKGVKTIAMAKSWDNASKFGFRERSDKFIVWGEFMKEEVIKYQDYSENEIEIIGVPQFDYYVREGIPSKDKFIKKYNLDPNKKIIFFGSEGPVSDNDPYLVSFLKSQIEKGILSDYQILVRPHFAYNDDEKRFIPLVDNKNIFVDSDYQRSNSRDGIELSLNNVFNLMMGARYSQVCITSASTLVLDFIANGKYPILYNFDKDKTIPLKDSIRRLYKSTWMREILEMNLDNMANSEEELIKKIKEVEKNHNIKIKERNNTIRKFCYKIDGKSIERLIIILEKILIYEK